jgi:uncharacterized protein (TIGR02186 family)
VADLSHHLVAITTAFAGSDVLLFGTVSQPDRDIVVTVQGPLVETSVRRKTEIGFIWLNTQEVVYGSVPEFYAVASTAPLTTIADPAELARYQIGAENLRLEATAIEGVGDRREPIFREALIRRKEQAGLFGARISRVLFVGGNLFRTTLHFPANVPPGNYEVRVFELEHGFVVAAQASTLIVSKVGLEADLYDIAHRQSALYGIAAVSLAVLAGWSAAMIFRRD